MREIVEREALVIRHAFIGDAIVSALAVLSELAGQHRFQLLDKTGRR